MNSTDSLLLNTLQCSILIPCDIWPGLGHPVKIPQIFQRKLNLRYNQYLADIFTLMVTRVSTGSKFHDELNLAEIPKLRKQFRHHFTVVDII